MVFLAMASATLVVWFAYRWGYEKGLAEGSAWSYSCDTGF
jgi:hypothetical protein